MSLSLASFFHVNAGVTRAAQLRGEVIAVDGYYFGYWFSYKRA